MAFDEPVVMEGNLAKISGYSLGSLGCDCALGQDVLTEEVINGLGQARDAEEMVANLRGFDGFGAVALMQTAGPGSGNPLVRVPTKVKTAAGYATVVPQTYQTVPPARPPMPFNLLTMPPRLPTSNQVHARQVEGLGISLTSSWGRAKGIVSPSVPAPSSWHVAAGQVSPRLAPPPAPSVVATTANSPQAQQQFSTIAQVVKQAAQASGAQATAAPVVAPLAPVPAPVSPGVKLETATPVIPSPMAAPAVAFTLEQQGLLKQVKILAELAELVRQKAETHDARAAILSKAPTWEQLKEAYIEAAKAAKAYVIAAELMATYGNVLIHAGGGQPGYGLRGIAEGMMAAETLAGTPVTIPIPDFPNLPLKMSGNRMDLTSLQGLGFSFSLKNVGKALINPVDTFKMVKEGVQTGVQKVKEYVGQQAARLTTDQLNNLRQQALARIDAATGATARQNAAVAQGAPPNIGPDQLPKPPGLPQPEIEVPAIIPFVPGPTVAVGSSKVPMLAVLAGAGVLGFLWYRSRR